MGKGGYHFWRRDHRWASMDAYNIRVFPPLVDEAPIEVSKVFPKHHLTRRITSNTSFHIGIKPQIVDSPELPEELLTNIYPNITRRKLVARSMFDIGISPQIGDEVYGIHIISLPDRARAKKVSNTAFQIINVPAQPHELPEGQILDSYRLTRKRVGDTAYLIIARFVVADSVAEDPPEGRGYQAYYLDRKRVENLAYLILNGVPQSSLAFLPPAIFYNNKDTIVTDELTIVEFPYTFTFRFSAEGDILITDVKDAVSIRDNF